MKAYAYLPITWTSRILLSRDRYWHDYFWNRWGFLNREDAQRLNGKRSIWIEAQSLGELYQMRALCRWMNASFPDDLLVCSTSDESAFQKAQEEGLFHLVLHSPWDLPAPVSRLFRLLKPRALFTVESAKFPLGLKTAYQKGIPTALLSGFFPEGWEGNRYMQRAMSLRFYEALQWIGVKGEEDAEGYKRLGVEPGRIFVLGDLKFSAEDIRLSDEQTAAYRKELGLHPDEILWVVGSLHTEEIPLIASACRKLREKFPRLRLLIAPRWIEHLDDMERRLRDFSCASIRKSKIQKEGLAPDSIILLDTYGELRYLYGLATFVFIGGSSLETEDTHWKGLCHNVAEPMLHEKPFFFGRNIHLRKAFLAQLLDCWPGLQVGSAEELVRNVTMLLEDRSLMERLRGRTCEIVGRQKETFDRHKELVERILQ